MTPIRYKCYCKVVTRNANKWHYYEFFRLGRGSVLRTDGEVILINGQLEFVENNIKVEKEHALDKIHNEFGLKNITLKYLTELVSLSKKTDL